MNTSELIGLAMMILSVIGALVMARRNGRRAKVYLGRAHRWYYVHESCDGSALFTCRIIYGGCGAEKRMRYKDEHIDWANNGLAEVSGVCPARSES